MTCHKVNAPTCLEIFSKADQGKENVKEPHKSVSFDLDSDGKSIGDNIADAGETIWNCVKKLFEGER